MREPLTIMADGQQVFSQPIFNIDNGRTPTRDGWRVYVRIEHRPPETPRCPAGFIRHQRGEPVEGWPDYFVGRGRNERMEEGVKQGVLKRSSHPFYQPVWGPERVKQMLQACQCGEDPMECVLRDGRSAEG